MKVELPIVSFISTVLVLIPLPFHWQTRSISMLSSIFWLALCNVIRGMNAIFWSGNADEKYAIWCDITAKLTIGANIGLPASVVCICRHLAYVSSPRPGAPRTRNKRRGVVFDSAMCVGLPIMTMVLHYFIQERRFDIIEDFGCQGSVYVSIPALFILMLPPIALSLASLVYAGVALRWFLHHRSQSRDVPQSTQSGLITDLNFRFIVVSITEMTLATTVETFLLFFNLQGGLKPWSWEATQTCRMVVGQFPKSLFVEYFWAASTMIWYIPPLTSVTFFTFFEFQREVVADYKKALTWIKNHLLRVMPKRTPVLPTTGLTTPLHVDEAINAPSIQLEATMDSPPVEPKTNNTVPSGVAYT